jgi:hypothetical protein
MNQLTECVFEPSVREALIIIAEFLNSDRLRECSD